MKRLIEHYGGVVLTSILSMAVMLSFFGTLTEGKQSVSSMFGSMIAYVSTKDSCQVKTKGAFDAYKAVHAPRVFMRDVYVARVGNEIELKDWIMSVDSNDEEREESILGIWKDKEEYVVQKNEMGKLCFSDAGNYWIKLSAKDSQGYERIVLAKVFVNER